MQKDSYYAVFDLRAESEKQQDGSGDNTEPFCYSFFPAFYDQETDRIFLSKYANGEPASSHVLDGLPEDLILARDGAGNVVAVKPSVSFGFVRAGVFHELHDNKPHPQAS